MNKTILFILALFIVTGISWAQDEDYYNYSGQGSPDVNINPGQFAPNIPSYYNPSLNLYSGYVAMNAYNNAMALKSATMQAMPVINYSNLGLPNQATSPAIDYQQLKLKALEQQADFQDYSLQQMEKNNEILRNNSPKNNNLPVSTEAPALEYQYNPAYNPAYNPSLEQK